MFIQQEILEESPSFDVEIPTGMMKKTTFLNHITSSTYFSTKRGNPEPLPELQVHLFDDTSLQCRRMFAHALIRMSEEPTIPKPIAAYTGFQTSVTSSISKSKAYFHVTLPNPPKKEVVYNVMVRCQQAAEHK